MNGGCRGIDTPVCTWIGPRLLSQIGDSACKHAAAHRRPIERIGSLLLDLLEPELPKCGYHVPAELGRTWVCALMSVPTVSSLLSVLTKVSDVHSPAAG